MSQADILDHIPTSAYMRIKEKDAHPEFRAYVIGEEGESTGKLIGIGSVVKRWARSAIQKLHEKIQFGMKAYHEHNQDNSHAGRKPVGETVGKFLREIGGKLQTILISYIYPEYRREPLDAASIEADIELKSTQNGHDVDVLDVTGVAFGDSKKFKPGFANAGLIMSLQEFENEINKGGNNPIKTAIEKEGFQPCDLFDKDDLLADRIIRSHVKSSINQEYERRLKAEDELKTFKDNQSEAVKSIEKERNEYRSQVWRSKAATELKQKVAEKNKDKEFITPKALKYIEKSLSTLQIDDEANIPKAVESFMDQKMEEFKEIFGDDTLEEKQKDAPKTDQAQNKADSPYFRL